MEPWPSSQVGSSSDFAGFTRSPIQCRATKSEHWAGHAHWRYPPGGGEHHVLIESADDLSALIAQPERERLGKGLRPYAPQMISGLQSLSTRLILSKDGD